MGRFSILFVVAVMVVCFVAPAYAQTNSTIIDVSGLQPDVSAVGTLAGAICAGLLGIWGVRKVIKLINRS